MGQFSWLDCITQEQILDNKRRDVYVLVPKEFRDVYGLRIKETYYDGYGNFGGYDIYDLVAEWNKAHLTIDMLEECPTFEQYGGLYDFEKEDMKAKGKTDKEIEEADMAQRRHYYEMGVARYHRRVEMLNDFKGGMSDAKMHDKYGDDWKREIGIDIACYDEQNAALSYPIKITHNVNAIYEECKHSLSDPNQGWPHYEDDEEEE